MDSIKLYVAGVFGGLRETPELLEQKDELIADLQAKVADLVEQGHSEDAAFGVAVASLGDFSELVAEYREAQHAEDARLAADEAVKAVEAAREPLPSYTVKINALNLHIVTVVAAATVALLFVASVFSAAVVGGAGIVASLGVGVAFLGAVLIVRGFIRWHRSPHAIQTIELDIAHEQAQLMRRLWLTVAVSMGANLVVRDEFWAWSPILVVACFGLGASMLRRRMLERGMFVVDDAAEGSAETA